MRFRGQVDGHDERDCTVMSRCTGQRPARRTLSSQDSTGVVGGIDRRYGQNYKDLRWDGQRDNLEDMFRKFKQLRLSHEAVERERDAAVQREKETRILFERAMDPRNVGPARHDQRYVSST